ncbi:alpha/beta hydrolase [Pseudomonas nicosulfuronedens]|uniref:Alpha/beta hydrolase n=1 Tax=Pseudomonas nicosulfuronedens TaxID=2571105 RepID=A0A5R9QR08_9PSED|nr:alpha/beta hydrolase [Pseudomonas nicosulfuronedens]MDH1008405.1 alpha/beta hydrolase [Pseudomonas nicosulfuronedens]MDH1979363.1 alpha/beta hydrolase [Pseudomonas nicosulfuronedens]MDH2027189.1 alpha/beta hydrolase [Pseudomonas nicosulfuronedens]TLX72087.1 alpha/beta hydrolase [Pseudomonas nicosulfuronedens]
MLNAKLTRALLWLVIVILAIAVLALGLRVAALRNIPPLEPWHTWVPSDLHSDQIDRIDWAGYLAAEDKLMQAMRKEMAASLQPFERVAYNRYFDQSQVYPGHFSTDWNRSYEMRPASDVRGAAVLLHGLTDSPYSLRHLGEHLRQQGFVVIAIRMPGHGTVPAGLTDADWEDWMAATRLAVREAATQLPKGAPLLMVGFSNGGALAMKYSLDALDDPGLTMPKQVVLISPMIGVTRYAQFAGLAGLPALLPAFAKAAWLNVLPEFNPFKYNSFPIAAARQTVELTDAVQASLESAGRSGSLARLPPILTFQSLADSTVSTPAVISNLYDRLPANGSELVLFDLNRSLNYGPLLRPEMATLGDRLLPERERNYDLTVISNSPQTSQASALHTPAHSQQQENLPLATSYPPDLFSLSHVALPFPPDDALYGQHPQAGEDFGIHLGTLTPRGERGVLIVGLDLFQRVTSNPFYDYLVQRVDQVLPGR